VEAEKDGKVNCGEKEIWTKRSVRGKT